jgi:two-component system nitrate/nitrite response regulator NarL
MADPWRVLVADDHPLYRSALTELLSREPGFSLCGAVESVDAIIAALDQSCDLVILDLRMPGMDGVAGIRRVRDKAPDVKVVLISGELTSTIIGDAVTAGATGFLPKSFDASVLIAALRLVMSGAIYVPHGMVPDPAAAAPKGAATSLTEREFEVLRHMAAGSAYKEIGRSLNIAEVTVKLHAQRIVRKLGVKNRAAAIAKAVKDGLVRTLVLWGL